MPPFVYLVPLLALFGASRFTAHPGGRSSTPHRSRSRSSPTASAGVSPTTVEAATSAGSNTWQMITKVQLPMSVRTLVAGDQPGPDLRAVDGRRRRPGRWRARSGYDVVAGFAQLQLFGKGLAAGLAIVLLGVMLDRITQAAAAGATG